MSSTEKHLTAHHQSTGNWHVNKIFFCFSSPSSCLWHLHQLQETMNSWMIPKLKIWVHGRRPVLARPAVWKQVPKSAENSYSLFFSESKYPNPQVSFKHQYSWVSLVLGASKPWVHPMDIPLWSRAHFPHWMQKAVYYCRFLEGTGNCKFPFDFLPLQWLHVWIRKMFKGHREIKTKSQLYCLRNVGIERTWLN